MPTARLASVALLAIRTQRIALCLAPPSRWQDLYGLGTARLELSGAAHALSADPLAEALALAPSVLGCPAAPLPTRWTYGPSPRHAVDRVAADDPATAPMLRFDILEVDVAAFTVAQHPLVEDLVEDILHTGVCLLHLVE